MADEHLMDVEFSDLDLNQEPSNPPLHRVERYGSLLNELETVHDRVEERIRQLEAVTARTTQRQRLRQARNSPEIGYIHGELMADVGQMESPHQRRSPNENNDVSVLKQSSERGKGCKRHSSHLVARALEMGSAVKKPEKEGGSFYDCNVCLEVAKEPVLTCCGHLFCWSCFYQVADIDSTSKECPVCEGEVSDSTVIPIYGNGDRERELETEPGLMVPPRPKAQRVESVRQQRVTRGLSHVPVAEALRRIRSSIGAVGNQTQQEGGNGIIRFRAGENAEPAGGHRLRIHQVSRVLSESAASLSALSSALSNAERLVEDLEAVINNRLVRNDTQPNHHSPVSTAETNVALPVASSQSTDVDHGLRTRVSTDVSLPLGLPPSSTGRRTPRSRTSGLDGREPRELRRRRLN